MRRKNPMSSADWIQFRRLMVYLRPHIGRFTIAMIAIVIGSVLGLAGPYTLQYLIDAVFTQNNAQLLNQITVILIIIFALQAVFYFIRAYQLQYIGERVMIDLRLNLFQHLQKLSLSFYNERRTGELVSRATNDVSTVRTLVTSDVSTAISQVITFFGALILILITDWRLTIFMLMLVPLVVIVALIFGRRLRKISSAVQDQLADATTVLEETLSGVRVVQSFTREDYEIGRYRNSIEQTFTLALKRIKLSATFGPVASFMGFAVVIAVFWFGGQQVLNGTLTAGQLTMFLILTLTIAGSIGSFSGLWTSLQEALGATKRIFEILDTPSDIVDQPEAKALPRIEGHIVLDNVSFAYKDNTDQHVLRGVSLEVKPGEVLALVGPSGAGKTTLVNLIPRFFDPQTGGVCIDGQDIRSVQVKSLREQIGLVPQDTLLFGGTVRENILYGKLDATEDELTEAARAANAHDFITQLSGGYETVVGERGVKLSGGQRQRIAIARAILKDPRILVLDEATSSLDSESEGLVQEALDRLMQGRTSVVIAHRLSTVHHADRIAVLERGQLVELGTHAELIALDGLYARLYKLQFKDNGAAAITEPISEEPVEAKPKPRSRSLIPGLIG
jgi:ATP-binding cassette, subfamily B, bacterial MsbA